MQFCGAVKIRLDAVAPFWASVRARPAMVGGSSPVYVCMHVYMYVCMCMYSVLYSVSYVLRTSSTGCRTSLRLVHRGTEYGTYVYVLCCGGYVL